MLAHQLQLAILLQEEGYCVQMIWWVVQTMRDLANIAQWHSGMITIISSFSLRYVNMAKLTPEGVSCLPHFCAWLFTFGK